MTELSAYRQLLADRREQRIREEEATAPRAKLCECETPWAYHEDEELRCLGCGREIR